MPISACRVCGSDLYDKPLLQYRNMPKAAQNFPDAAALSTEAGEDLTVCQCSGCGLVQLRNDPVPYYREVIRAAAVSAVIREAKTRQFSDWIRKHSLRGRKVIEIGCGRGEFLSLLPGLDVDARGLEDSASAVAACQAAGLRVTRGYLERGTQVPGGPFDAFLLLMFLEHMPDPNASLRGLRDNLAAGAVGLVEVPNFDMVIRKKLFSEFIGDHLLYFTRNTLAATLGRNGFDVIECGEVRDEYVLSAAVRKRGPLDISDFHSSQETIVAQINAFLGRFGEKQVAVWGAGHQALAIAAMANLAGRVRYVVDSAPFKQGKYTPATHLPVVPPETLRRDPVEAVIVMAASYSDEVAGILRRDFPPQITIAILREQGLELLAP